MIHLLPQNFFESIKNINRAIFGAKFYLIESCLIFTKYLIQKMTKFEQIGQFFVKIFILIPYHSFETGTNILQAGYPHCVDIWS